MNVTYFCRDVIFIMLQKLIIKNYAIIDYLTIEPDAHLNTVTGETGAGKSIIIGALSLILGERADTSVLINKDEKCVVEGYFHVGEAQNEVKALLEKEDLYDGETCIIRREIASSGKSRAFINDTPVTLQLLSSITGQLVDMHQQFDHLSLEDDYFQMNVVDALAGNMHKRQEYQQLYAKHKSLNHELGQYQAKKTQLQKEADYKQFLWDELQQAQLKEDEIELAEQQMKQLAHAERILQTLQASKTMLNEGEQPVIQELKRINQQLTGITDVFPIVEALKNRLNSAWEELKDIAAELEDMESTVNLDGELMLQMQERIDIGYKLLKKHAVHTTAELLQIQHQLEQELATTVQLDEIIEQLTAERTKVYEQLLTIAKELTAARTAVVDDLAEKVTTLLGWVGMPNARFKVALTTLQAPGAWGMDEVQFLLDANKSQQFQPIYKVASGGEMSRIMLCIKSLTAKAMHMPTLIFDEVDTGISGEAARQVGILLKDLSTYHQVICITHQPQVAAKGMKHFYVYKDSEQQSGRITTQVRVLKPEERILSIARMIGGEQPSEAALQNARELVAD
jgi:DNA repair protein RecN (Recombination protein N)